MALVGHESRRLPPESAMDKVGCGTTSELMVKLLVVVEMPPAAMTESGPVVAPDGTVAVIWFAEFKVNDAAWPLNQTVVVPVKFVPLITTELLRLPLVGVTLVMPVFAEPSTLARRMVARLVFNVVKKLKPVLVCKWFTLVM